MIRRRRWILVAVFFSLITQHSSLITVFAETANRIVALVNDEVITEGDVRAYMSRALSDAPSRADVQQAALQRLTEERLIIQEAKRLGLAVSQEDVLERLRAIKGQFQNKDEYLGMLDEAGIGEEQLKIKLRDQLFARKAIEQQVRRTIHVSPNEVAQAASIAPPPAAEGEMPAEEMLVWHVLVRAGERRSATESPADARRSSSGGRSVDEARALAERVRQQAMHGAALDALAREHSEDPRAAAEGGMLGWVRRGDLLPELDAALAQLKADEVSEPIHTSLGFHVLKIIQRRAADPARSNRAPLTVEQQLYQQKFNAAMSAWVDSLKAKAYIEILDH